MSLQNKGISAHTQLNDYLTIALSVWLKLRIYRSAGALVVPLYRVTDISLRWSLGCSALPSYAYFTPLELLVNPLYRVTNMSLRWSLGCSALPSYGYIVPLELALFRFTELRIYRSAGALVVPLYRAKHISLRWSFWLIRITELRIYRSAGAFG